jgi:4-amino-4-deoxy-L-arabinose transferase-like glycosyltransferase
MQAKPALLHSGNPCSLRHKRWLGIPILAWIILFATAANLPFINQAFHMDDGIYLLIARNVRHNPWFPQDLPVFFEGLHASDLASTEHPWPLTSYLAAAIAFFSGFSEVGLHAGFLIFPIILAWGMYSLSFDLTRYPALAALCLLALPVVSVLSHTLMTDIPLLAFWLTAVVFFRRGLRSGRAGPLWAGAMAAALACMVTYSGVCVVVLLVGYALMRRKPWAALIIGAIPVALLAGLFLTNYLHYRRVAPAMVVGSYIFTKHVFSPDLLLQKCAFVILSLGAVTVSPLFAFVANRLRVTFGLLLAAMAVCWLAPQASNYGGSGKVLFIVFFWAGSCLLACVIGQTLKAFRIMRKEAEPGSDDLLLGSWMLGVLLFCVAAYMTGSARHLLPAMPPLILILFRFMERRRERLAFRLSVANAALCMIAACALSISDYQFAGIYREFAGAIRRSANQAKATWFTGEWGFRAYLEQDGGQELGRRDARAKPGDLLMVPTLATPYSTLYSDRLSLPSIALIAPSSISFEIPPTPAGSTLFYTAGMPFYSSSDGMEFTVLLATGDRSQILSEERIEPSQGRIWKTHELSLPDTARQGGKLILQARVGSTGNGTADWIAIARARIALLAGGRAETLYDFRQNLAQAQITPAAGRTYDTPGNLPVVPMEVWLEQTPATVLRTVYRFTPGSPIRLLDNLSHAGFWSSGWGLLPFSFAEKGALLESISVYEVTREVDDYGERPGSWYEK